MPCWKSLLRTTTRMVQWIQLRAGPSRKSPCSVDNHCEEFELQAEEGQLRGLAGRFIRPIGGKFESTFDFWQEACEGDGSTAEGLAERASSDLQECGGAHVRRFGVAQCSSKHGRSRHDRGWTEQRSRISGFPQTVSLGMGCAQHIGQSQGFKPRAGTSSCLPYAMSSSLDRGSHILSQEMSLEPPPPYASFNAHVIPDQLDVPFTRIMDPRWVEAMAAKLGCGRVLGAKTQVGSERRSFERSE